MIKNSLKYYTIVTVNLILLTLLLLLWTDRLELKLNSFVRSVEFSKIAGLSFISLIAIWIFVHYTRNRIYLSPIVKIKLASLLTLLLSSYLYVDYTSRVIKNLIVDKEFRQQLSMKIKTSKELIALMQTEGINSKEYRVIANYKGFIDLPMAASNIKFDYQSDDFLPDYLFRLSYDLPKQSRVENIDYETTGFSKYQSFVITGEKIRVTYEEQKQ